MCFTVTGHVFICRIWMCVRLCFLFGSCSMNPPRMLNPAQFGNLITSAVETVLVTTRRRCKACVVFFCAWMDVGGSDVDVICDGCTGCPVPAFTKTTGLITNPRRLAGSRTSGNEQLCLVSARLVPPAVGASGLHRTPRSARYVYLFYCECIKVPRRGGPPCPPAQNGVLTSVHDRLVSISQKSRRRGGLPRPPAEAVMNVCATNTTQPSSRFMSHSGLR